MIGIAIKNNDKGLPDIYLDETGNLAIANKSDAIAQHAKQRLMAFQGEWFLNADAGLPWLTDIFARQYDKQSAERIIKKAIEETEGVTEITEFSIRFNKEKREISAYSISIKTVYEEEVTL